MVGLAVEIVVKVNRSRIDDPAGHVAKIVRRARGVRELSARAEEIFPDVHVGHSAGLVSLELPDDVTTDDSERILQALRDDEAIEYANRPSPRSPK